MKKVIEMEIEWSRLKAPEPRARAKREAVVIVPVASTEQHGPHLPTNVDCLLVGEIARSAAAQAWATTPTLITPVVWTGFAEHHMSLGATISLHYAEFFAVLRGICRSLVRHGFKKVLLLNGHSGNLAALTVAVNELVVEFDAPIATRPIGCWRSRTSLRSSRSRPMCTMPARQKLRWYWP